MTGDSVESSPFVLHRIYNHGIMGLHEIDRFSLTEDRLMEVV